MGVITALFLLGFVLLFAVAALFQYATRFIAFVLTEIFRVALTLIQKKYQSLYESELPIFNTKKRAL